MASTATGPGAAGQRIEFQTEDGSSLAAYLSLPSEGKGPGIVVLNDDAAIAGPIEGYCDYLAEDGYVVLAPALHGRSHATDDHQTMIGDVRAAIMALASHADREPGVGLVGFGRGAVLALQAADEIGAEVVIGYDPVGLDQPGFRATRNAYPVVLHLAGGHHDAGIDRVRDMVSAVPRFQVFTYDGCAPGFALRDHPAYDKLAARVAYSRSLTPLRRELGPVYDLAGLLWEHLRYEFETKDPDATMETMVETPYVNHIPTMTGGVGHDELKRFYKYHFIPKQPKDRNMLLISETVGADTVVLEFVSRFTHNDPFDHWLPGVPPTGKYCEVPVVVIAKFRGGKLYNEHIYWDSASVLAQIGLIDQDNLPVAGIQGAKKLLDESLPSNELMPNWHESEGKPL